MPTPVAITDFGGLDVQTDAQNLGFSGAVDAVNIDLDIRGKVRSRDGVVRVGSSTLSGADSVLWAAVFGGVFYTASFTIAGTTLYLDSVQTNGAVTGLGSWVAPAGQAHMAALGTPTASYVFVASQGTTLRKWSGAALTASTGKPTYVATSPTSNRLVQACFAAAADSPTGANGSQSTVFFSDPGAPETYGANNYIHLQPGDGEVITGMVAWQNLLFVSKATSIFVIYGESTDAAGNPIFSYRRIAVPGPHVIGAGAGQMVAGEDGVYFTTGLRVYRTTGGTPQHISAPIDPFMPRGNDAAPAASIPYYADSLSTNTIGTLSYVDGRLFCIVGSDSPPRIYVYDVDRGFWLLWEIANLARVPIVTTSGTALLFGTDRFIYTLDDDTACERASRYRTGFGDLGSPGVVKRVREWLVDGYGAPTLKVATDDGSLGTGVALTLGTSPVTAESRDRRSAVGRNFSLELSASSGAWAVSRVVAHVAEQRAVGPE